MAQGNIGTPGNPLSEVHGEQWVLTPRTSDPGSTEEGELWYRSDLSEFRFDHGSGVWQVPVFPRGTSGSEVEEVLRVPDDTEASVNRGADNQTSASVITRWGIAIETKTEIDTLTATISSNTPPESAGGPSTAYLQESDGTELESAPITQSEAVFTTTLNANTEYQIVADREGSPYDLGRDSSPTFPYTGDQVDIIGGVISDDQRDDTSARVFTTVETTISEGFIPLVENGGAFSQVRFQHNGSWYGFHDSTVLLPGDATHYWPWDEGSGTTTADANGSADGSITGANWTSDADAVGGQALDFGAPTDDWYVEVPDQASIDPSTGSFTVGIWVKFDAANLSSDGGVNGAPITKRQLTGGDNYGYQIDVERISSSEAQCYARLRDSNADSVATSGSLTNVGDDGWHFIALIRDTSAGELILHVDGTNERTATDNTNDISNSNNLWFGRYIESGSNQTMPGLEDAPFFDNEARSEATLSAYYNNDPRSP